MANDGGRTLVASLRDDIMRGTLGPGQRLVEAELTERYGVTRGAVRQALMSLEGEGLVERERNRGARVRSISLDEAIEITEARAVLEGLCAAKAAVNATPRERDELRRLGDVMAAAVAAEDVMRYSSTTQDLHRYVREVARQQTVADLLDRLRYQSVRYHFSVALLPGRPSVGLAEHREVIETIVAGDADAAEAVMRGHLFSVIDALQALAERESGHLVRASG
ncbi:GntR family transcriptional regulator [Egicoccus sp. AB-alg2]|uniref:GntR family transcriptional regulator n=1 Tax=Egicoccus sp. AB-alg2 TaxID=3242693 RepID=UPI00359EF817